MPFAKDPQTLEKIFRAAVQKEQSIRAKLAEENYREADLLADIERDSDQIWESVADEIRKFGALESEYQAADAQWRASWPERPKPEDIRRPFSEALLTIATGLSGLYAFFVMGFGIYRLYRGWGTILAALSSGRNWLIIGLYLAPVLIGVVLVTVLEARRDRMTAAQQADLELRRAAWEQANAARMSAFGLTDRSAQMNAQQAQIEARLTERVTRQIRLAINRRTDPSYGPELNVERPRAFGEVSDAGFWIETPARKHLESLLNDLSGGSIGIAGSRGAGKTTLLRNFCGPKRVIERLQNKDVLGVLVSAPVAYQAREFLLYLFGATCQSVIEHKRGGGARLAAPVIARETVAAVPEPAADLSAIPELRRLPVVLVRFGALLFALGLAASLLLAVLPKPGASEAAASASPAAAAAPVRPRAGPAAPPVKATPPAAAAAASDPVAFAGRWLNAMGIAPGAMLAWGGSAVLIGLALGMVIRRNALLIVSAALPLGGLLRQLPAVQRAAEREAQQRRQSAPPPSEEEDKGLLVSQAEAWLRTIKFQQSFTSGWSGSLKLPVGLEGGLNRALTFSQNQLSLPEIAYFFGRFIELAVDSNYQVLIGIDELDKIANDELARQFVNDIKAIFGLERCFYLVSVSEDAMSSFERRGLPFRDAFDSAFDEMIYVDHLKFKLATKLLEQRILGRPVPFFALSYCLSGGLPRDLIRSFRSVLAIGAGQPGTPRLSAVCARLLTDDVIAKARAIGVSVRKISLEPQVDLMLEALHDLELIAGSDVKLERQAEAMLRPAFLADAAPAAQPSADDPKEQRAPDPPVKKGGDAAKLQKVRDLAEEVATYALFIVALRRFFTDQRDQNELIRLIQSGDIDQMAEARRYIGVHPQIARSLIKTFDTRYLASS